MIVDAFKKGLPVKTKSGKWATLIAVLNDTPAPILVDINGRMENYFTNGKYLGSGADSDMDLMVDHSVGALSNYYEHRGWMCKVGLIK
jgi:hypothetical protein